MKNNFVALRSVCRVRLSMLLFIVYPKSNHIPVEEQRGERNQLCALDKRARDLKYYPRVTLPALILECKLAPVSIGGSMVS